MPVALPDVNVLLALMDSTHQHHEAANTWFAYAGQNGWATCPLTENGFVRIVSSPSYPGASITPEQALILLDSLVQNFLSTHHFWQDSISLRDRTIIKTKAIIGHRQLTDIYLLGLCQQNGGTLVTLDLSISTTAIVSSRPDLVNVLG